MTREVAVLGTGIIGLLTAMRLQEHGYRPLMFSEGCPPYSTSAAAGGVVLPFFPFRPDSAEFKRRMIWARSSAAMYRQLEGGEYCSVVTHIEFCENGLLEGWFPIEWFPDAELENVELINLTEPLEGFNQYVRFGLTCIDTVRILQKLFAQIMDRGAEHHRVRLSIDDVNELPTHDIFNCLGYGSARVFGDQELVPYFGQAIRFAPADVQFGVGIGDFVALSMVHGLYIGSLFVKGEKHPIPRQGHYERLFEFADKTLRTILPIVDVECALESLGNPIETVAGVRPYRVSGIRLELEILGKKLLVHNYGHGAHGWTTGWGSVMEAVRLWEERRGAMP